MTKNYEIVLNYIKDLSVEIPNAETFLFSRENLTKYTLGLNISTKPIKDQTIEVITNLNYKDKNENKRKSYFEISYATSVCAPNGNSNPPNFLGIHALKTFDSIKSLILLFGSVRLLHASLFLFKNSGPISLTELIRSLIFTI